MAAFDYRGVNFHSSSTVKEIQCFVTTCSNNEIQETRRTNSEGLYTLSLEKFNTYIDMFLSWQGIYLPLRAYMEEIIQRFGIVKDDIWRWDQGRVPGSGNSETVVARRDVLTSDLIVLNLSLHSLSIS